MVAYLVSKRLPVVGEGGWVCRGEPWLGRAVVGGVVTCLVGSGVTVAGIDAGFASEEPWLSSWITFSCIAVRFSRFETAVHENVSKTTLKSSRFRA